MSLAHASTARPAAQQPRSLALREALGQLTPAFAALAEGGDANTTQAALHATRARRLMTDAEQTGGSHSQLIARLVETCAGDTLRLTGTTDSRVPLSGDTHYRRAGRP
ncbi:MAG TPA: hypothetical protein VIY52_04430 [Streptosporangiaceae bacterium]